jgi:predicted dehydrogenase
VLFEQEGQGYVTAVSRQELTPVPVGEAKPTRIDRLVAAVEGRLDADELEADLVCAVDAVATMEACYQSSEKGTWVSVARVS